MLAYRFLSGTDNSVFCHKVTAALASGWQLYGSPIYAFNAAQGAMYCGQAVVKEVAEPYDPALKLGDL